MRYLTYLFETGGIPKDKRVPGELYRQLLSNMQRIISLVSFVFSSGCASQSEIVLIHCALDYAKAHDGENITVAQAANQIGVPVPSVSRSLRSLSEKGFIERYNDPNDRRTVRLKVTETGENELRKLLERIFSVFDSAFRSFSDEEITMMTDLHDRFTDAVYKAVTERRTTDNAGN